MIWALILAWALAQFGFDKIVITTLQEWFKINLSKENYYFIAAIIGLMGNVVVFITTGNFTLF